MAAGTMDDSVPVQPGKISDAVSDVFISRVFRWRSSLIKSSHALS